MSPDPFIKQHSKLQAAITRDFVACFAPKVKLLYLEDGAKQTLLFEKEGFAAIGVPLTSFSGLPDTILFDEAKNRLIMIQGITIHFPTSISSERRKALEHLFAHCTATRVYVNAFLDFTTFRNFIDDVARESEVWIAEAPSHLIRVHR